MRRQHLTTVCTGRTWLSCASLALFALGGAPAWAATTLDADARHVESIGYAEFGVMLQEWNRSEDRPSEFLQWSAAISGMAVVDGGFADGSAFQDSFATADEFSGRGDTSGSVDFQNGFATTYQRSVYDIAFSVDVATRYQLAGSIYADNALGNKTAFELYDAQTLAALEGFYVFDSSRDFISAGILSPGQYRLLVQATTSFNIAGRGSVTASGAAGYEFNLRLNPVPLPAGVWLLLSALAGTAVFRRKTTRQGINP